MYHTFQFTSEDVLDPASWPVKTASGRLKRITTTNACLECRRRKIRCDGEQPCNQCQWYRRSKSCKYTKPTQRVVPSQALIDRLMKRVARCETVLDRVFPGRDVEWLLSLSQDDLLSLASNGGDNNSQSICTSRSPTVDGFRVKSDIPVNFEDLEQGHTRIETAEKSHGTSVKCTQEIAGHTDGLSLSTENQILEDGIGSVTAALHAIFAVSPASKAVVAQWTQATASTTIGEENILQMAANIDASTLPTSGEGKLLLDAYFTRVHTLMPMVDEQELWQSWSSRARRDAPYLALLNTLLALGATTSCNLSTHHHTVYFRRAMFHINKELPESGSILVVQAIGLLSGYYLPYIERPKLANSLMLAAFRMATALGMHREFSTSSETAPNVFEPVNSAVSSPVEIKRRTWWALMNLDTWASMAQGTPFIGNTGADITVRPPQVIMTKMTDAQYREALKMLPLIHSTAFSEIATRAQKNLATHHVLDLDLASTLDQELILWQKGLPSILVPTQHEGSTSTHSCKRRRLSGNKRCFGDPKFVKSARDDVAPISSKQIQTAHGLEQCPEFLRTARLMMHFRYQNLRMLLYRPALLSVTLKRIKPERVSVEDQTAIQKCRTLAAQAIVDINTLCEEEPIATWNGVELMYQAAMVPLVSLFGHLESKKIALNDDSIRGENDESNPKNCWYPYTGQEPEADQWESQVKTAISFFDRVKHLSATANKRKDVVLSLYEAFKHFWTQERAEYQRHHEHTTPIEPEFQHDLLTYCGGYQWPPDTTTGQQRFPSSQTPPEQLTVEISRFQSHLPLDAGSYSPSTETDILGSLLYDQSHRLSLSYASSGLSSAVSGVDNKWTPDNCYQDIRWDVPHVPSNDNLVGVPVQEYYDQAGPDMLGCMQRSIVMDPGWH